MKFVKLVLGVLAALWTIGVAIGFVQEIGKHGGMRGTVEILAGLAVTAGCAAISIWLFQSALRKP